MTEEDEKAGRDPVMEELQALATLELDHSVAAAVLVRLAAQLWIREGGNRSSFDELAKSMASAEQGPPGVCKVCRAPLDISEDDARELCDWFNRHTNATPGAPVGTPPIIDDQEPLCPGSRGIGGGWPDHFKFCETCGHGDGKPSASPVPASPVVPSPANPRRTAGLPDDFPSSPKGPPPHTCEFNTSGYCDVCGVSSPHRPREPKRTA